MERGQLGREGCLQNWLQQGILYAFMALHYMLGYMYGIASLRALFA